MGWGENDFKESNCVQWLCQSEMAISNLLAQGEEPVKQHNVRGKGSSRMEKNDC